MKVLWFTNTPSLYDRGKHHYHGGGWIESLEDLISKRPEIELAIAFFHPNDNKKVKNDGVCYFPILRKTGKKNPVRSLINNWCGRLEHDDYQKTFSNIIDDFKPDVIQVFGTEGPFALIQEFTKVPVLVHLQGIINPILNSFYPSGFSKWDFILNPRLFFKNLIGSSPFFSYKRFKTQAEREKKILAKLNYVCGRTEWDREIVEFFNPIVRYFHVDEVLRPVFYEKSSYTNPNKTEKFIILSTLSPTIYKGIDVMLKTAGILSEMTDVEFEWRVIGLDTSSDLLHLFEQKLGKQHQSVGIKLLGKMSPEQIIDQMLNADVFVHPSYIDNSPNSVCEAQILGIPVIACDVGGLSSLIDHKESGILVPSNGVFELVHYLKLLRMDNDLKSKLGERGKEKAQVRHEKERIVETLLAVYKEIH
jgi:glycosyltransferase involved in cell wall biosynthesis